MPTTRSATKKQTKLEDFTDDQQPKDQSKPRETNKTSKKSRATKTTQPKANISAKRQSSPSETSRPASLPKKQKQQHFTSTDSTELESPIVINRAPVLQLWSATVAQFLNPGLPWSACLSIGNCISSLCAISKGRSVGTVEQKSDKSDEHRQEREKAKDDTQEYNVMGFDIHLKGNAALMGGKPRTLNENTLQGKFGGEKPYEAVKKAMNESLETWKDDKQDLNSKSFHMYERFRPDVASGQQGWGRKES